MRAVFLVDTRCTTTLLKLACGCCGSRITVKPVDGTEVKLHGMKLTTKPIIIDCIINRIDIVIGMNMISKLGGLSEKMMRLSLERYTVLQVPESQTGAELMTKTS